MADPNQSSDVNSDSEHSGDTPRRSLPPPDDGDNVDPVPVWEREFCHNAYDIPWETFCENKRFIGLYQKVMEWDDSGALKNFEDAKERFRAKYYGEPFEDPVLDPDMYIDEVGQTLEAVRGAQPYRTPNNSDNNLHGGGPSNTWHQQGVDPRQTSSGTATMLPGGGRLWMSGAFTGGAIRWNDGGGSGNARGRDYGGSGSGGGGGRGGNGGGGGGGWRSNWNCFSRCRNQRNQDEGQHQQRDGGGMRRNQDQVQHQMSSGSGRQQQHQRGMRMGWRPVQQNRGSQR